MSELRLLPAAIDVQNGCNLVRIRLEIACDFFDPPQPVVLAIEVGPTAAQIASQLGRPLTSDEIAAITGAVRRALNDKCEGTDFGELKPGDIP